MSLPFNSNVQQISQHVGESTGGGRGFSAKLWSYMAKANESPDGSDGSLQEGDDFTRFQGFLNAISGTTALPSTTVPGPSGYKIYADSATTASGTTRVSTAVGGVANLLSGATDNHLCTIGAGNLCKLSDTADDAKLTIFETRFRHMAQVTSGSVFLGLGSVGAIVDAGQIVNAGGIKADQSAIGFLSKEDDPDAIDFIYQAASGAEQTVISAAGTAVAGTWFKMGFVYDPNGPTTKRIRCFIDGVEQTDDADYVTDANIAAATFPDAEMVGPLFSVMSEGTVAKQVDIDWWALYQEG